MAPVTEIAYISLKPGIQLTGSSDGAKAWADTIKTIQAQDGYQRLHWGVSLENESLLMLLIGIFSLRALPFLAVAETAFESRVVLMRAVDWDSVGSHQKFMDDPSYGSFKKTLGLIMEGVHLFHITPTPFPPTILSEVSLAPSILHCSFCLPEPHVPLFILGRLPAAALSPSSRLEIRQGKFGADG
jgi:hypothetical protein